MSSVITNEIDIRNILTKFECGKVVCKVLKSNVEMFLAFFLSLILSFGITGSEF